MWLDREIGGGEEWRRSIEQNLEAASDVVVLLSPNAVASPWVQHEGSLAQGLKKPIYPVLIAEVPEDDLPIWMEELQYINFVSRGYEAGFAALRSALTPPNPRQDLLEQQVDAHRQTGALMSEAVLDVIEEAKDLLAISPEAAEVIQKSERSVKRRRQLLRGGVGFVAFLVLLAVGSFISLIWATRSRSEAQATAEAGVPTGGPGRSERGGGTGGPRGGGP